MVNKKKGNYFKGQNIHAFVLTISQKTALNKISRQKVRWVRLSSLRDLISKKMQCQRFFNFKIGIDQKRSHGNNQPCPPKSGTTPQGNSESVRSAFGKTKKIEDQNLPSCCKLDLA